MSSKDIDIQIENKRAELNTLHRATEYQLSQQKKLKSDLDKELAEAAEKAEKALTDSLKSAHLELTDLNSQIDTAKQVLKQTIKDYEAQSIVIDDEKTRHESEKSTVEGIISELLSRQLVLESTIKVLTNKIEDLYTTINTLTANKESLEAKVRELYESVENLEEDISLTKSQFADDKKILENEIKETETNLTSIKAQLNIANRLLVEAQTEEENIRENISSRYMILQNREDMVDKREAKITQQEKRLFNYNKFSKL